MTEMSAKPLLLLSQESLMDLTLCVETSAAEDADPSISSHRYILSKSNDMQC